MRTGLLVLLAICLVQANRRFPDGLVVHLDSFSQNDLRLSQDGSQAVEEWQNKVDGKWFVVNRTQQCPRFPWTPEDEIEETADPCRPIFVADQINHGGVVRFDGVQDYMELQGNFRTPGSNGGSHYGNAHIFIVARGTDRAGYHPWQRLISAHDDNRAWDDWQSPNWEFSGPRQLDGTEINFPAQLMVQKKTQVHIKNIRLATKWNGQWTSRIEIGEVLIFERLLSEPEAMIVSDMLEMKWGFKSIEPEVPDPLYLVPAGGYAEFAGRFRASIYDFPVQRWVSIPQTAAKEWDMLGNRFTLEAWFKLDVPEQNPETGACCVFDDGSKFEDAGIYVNRFLPILSRHPSMYLNNAYSHFNLQLTRIPAGIALAAWTGCGCIDPNDLATCDMGYVVSSDSRYLPDNQKVYIKPDTWYHVAVSFDGDDTSLGFESRQARMYINGQYLVATNWADPNLNDPLKNPGVCKGRGMVTSAEGANSVTVGFYSNHDGLRDALPDGTPVTRDYGFDGKIDEVRIWNRVLSPTEVATWFDVTLTDLPFGAPTPEGLVGYYSWKGKSLANQASENGAPYALLKNGTQDDNKDTEFWGTPWEEPNFEPLQTIHSRVHVVGRNTMNPVPPAQTGKDFRLGGYFPDANGTNIPLVFKVEAISPYLSFAIDAGDVRFEYMNGDNVANITKETIPSAWVTRTQDITVFADCHNASCANLGMGFRNYWLEYRPTYIDQSGNYTEGLPAKVFFEFDADCQAEYDQCGVCGGDNRSCQCTWYLNVKSSRMAHTLYEWSVDHILEKVNCSISALKDTLTVVQNPHWEQEQTQPEIIDQIEYMMGFYNNCLNSYCKSVHEFQEQLVSYLEAIKMPIVGSLPK